MFLQTLGRVGLSVSYGYTSWDFPGDPVVRTSPSSARGAGSIPGQGAKISRVVVQSLSCVQLFMTPWTEALQASLSFTISWGLLKLRSIESVMPSNHLILCRPVLLPSIFLSFRVFSSESALHIRWPKYGNFSFSISPSGEHSGLISFRIDWFDLTYFVAKKQNIKQKQYCNNLNKDFFKWFT